jgi:hypothetical protein
MEKYINKNIDKKIILSKSIFIIYLCAYQNEKNNFIMEISKIKTQLSIAAYSDESELLIPEQSVQ